MYARLDHAGKDGSSLAEKRCRWCRIGQLDLLTTSALLQGGPGPCGECSCTFSLLRFYVANLTDAQASRSHQYTLSVPKDVYKQG